MAFKRTMERAKIKGRMLREATGAGCSQSSLSFHSLRHLFNAGIAPELRLKLTGYSSADMNRIYTHHELEPLRKAVGVIESLGRLLQLESYFRLSRSRQARESPHARISLALLLADSVLFRGLASPVRAAHAVLQSTASHFGKGESQ